MADEVDVIPLNSEYGNTGFKVVCRSPPSSSYTIAELKQLAHEFVNTRCAPEQLLISQRLQLSVFLAWLAKREQGKESDNGR